MKRKKVEAKTVVCVWHDYWSENEKSLKQVEKIFAGVKGSWVFSEMETLGYAVPTAALPKLLDTLKRNDFPIRDYLDTGHCQFFGLDTDWDLLLPDGSTKSWREMCEASPAT